MSLLDATTVDNYVTAFKSAGVISFGGAAQWDTHIVECNSAPPRFERSVRPDAAWEGASKADLLDVAPLLVRLLGAQVTDEHLRFLDAIGTRVWSSPPRVQRNAIDAFEALRAVLTIDPRGSELCEHKWLIAAPLMFALTEHVLKVLSPAFVDLQGVPLQPWTVTVAGKQKSFAPGSGPKTVNRIGHLLALGRTQTLPTDARGALDAIEAELAQLEGIAPPLGHLDSTLDRWRNELLHGQQLWTARGPVQLAVLCVLALDQ